MLKVYLIQKKTYTRNFKMQKEKKTTTITNECTGCNRYEIKPICSSTSSLDISSSAIDSIAALPHTLTVSVSMWDKNHLDRIHTLIPKLQKNYATVNIDAIPQDIEMQKISCKL